MDTALTIKIVIVVAMLLATAFFSSSETALFSVGKIRLKHLAEQQSHSAERALHLLGRPERLLTTILVGNTVATEIATVVGTSAALFLWGERGVIIAAIALTVGMLLLGEIIPKTLAALYAEKHALRVAKPVGWLAFLLTPITRPIEAFAHRITARTGRDPLGAPTFTHDEFQSLLAVGEKEGTFGKQESEMLQNVTQFRDRQVKEILKTHRIDVVGVRNDITYDDLQQVIATQQFSRYPVFKDTLDQVLGVLYVKDLFSLTQEARDHFDVTRAMRKGTLLVPATREVSSLFREMKAAHMHMAIILDEYGGTLGVVTLEDILETIVGSIEDETDTEETKMIVEMTANRAVVTPNLSIHSFNDEFGANLPNEDVETVGGFVLKEMDRLPQKGETLLWEDLRITVLGLKGNRISLLRVDRIPAA